MSAPNQAEARLLIDLANKLASDSITGFWANGATIIQQLLESGAQSFWKPLSEHLRDPLGKVIDELKGYGVIRAEDAAAIKRAFTAEADTNWMLQLLVTMALMTKYIATVMEVPGMKVQQGVLKQIRPQLPYVSEVIAAAFIAPEKTGDVREILAKTGYSEDDIDLLFLSKYAVHDVQTVRDLWLRGEINDSRMYERLRELGFTDTRIGEMSKLWQVIPPIQDILTMVAREAFEPDSVQKLGLDAEFPTEQSEWLSKQGLSDYWQRKYWAAHWDQPSIQQGYEMLHRQVIDRDTLEMLFRTVEIPSFWREKLTQIAYQPYTRVDVRRMYDMGVIDESQLHKAYTDIGYDDEHADGMTEFTKRYVEDAERDLTKTEILKGYREKLLTRQDCIDLLTDIRYTQAQAEYYVELEDFNELKEIQTAAIQTIETKYKNKLIDRAEAQRLLDALNLPAAQVTLWLEKWDVALIEYPRLPSKTDLDKFYVQGIISADQYNLEMQKLGYGHIYISWYKAVNDAVLARTSQP